MHFISNKKTNVFSVKSLEEPKIRYWHTQLLELQEREKMKLASKEKIMENQLRPC